MNVSTLLAQIVEYFASRQVLRQIVIRMRSALVTAYSENEALEVKYQTALLRIDLLIQERVDTRKCIERLCNESETNWRNWYAVSTQLEKAKAEKDALGTQYQEVLLDRDLLAVRVMKLEEQLSNAVEQRR